MVCVDVVADNARAVRRVDHQARRRGARHRRATSTDEAQVQAMVARVRDGLRRRRRPRQQRGDPRRRRACSTCRSSAGTRQIAVNLTGTFLCTKHVGRLMVERGPRGSIIVIVSTAGHQGQAGQHRLLHEQERPPQLHAGGGDGPREAPHSREQPHADRDGRRGRRRARRRVGPAARRAPRAPARLREDDSDRASCRARATTRGRPCSSRPTTRR